MEEETTEEILTLEEKVNFLKGHIQYLYGEIVYYKKCNEVEKQKLNAMQKQVNDTLRAIEFMAKLNKDADDFVKENAMPNLEEAEKFLKELMNPN